MPNYDYDFRILIDSKNGEKKSYGTASFVSADGTTPILTTSQVLDRINSLEEIIYYNSKTYTTSSLDALFVPKTAFTFTNTDSGGDYQFLSASIKGNSDSGSIVFTGNSTPSGSSNDFIKRYKFYGNKVCNVLGIPENYWIYVDKFRLTNTGSEQNYLSGDVLGQSLHLTHNLSIANRGAVESDLPFQHAKDTDRWLKWRNVSGSVPHNELQIGYSNLNDRYEIRTSDGGNDLTGTGVYGTLPLVISASNLEIIDPLIGGGHITASGGIRIGKSSHFNQNLTIAGSTTFLGAGGGTSVHNLSFEHDTNPMGITFFGFLGKMQFKLPVGGTSTTLMELSSSDAGTATLDLTGDITASGNIGAHGNLLIGDRLSSSDIQNRSNISCYSRTSNNIMIVNTDPSIVDGQYIGGIGFIGSDGSNEDSHPTSSNAAIMVRAGEGQGSSAQGAGLEFRIKNIDDLDNENPVTSSIAYRINPFKHSDSENDDVYGLSGNDRVNAQHEFVGSSIFKHLTNIATAGNTFMTQSSWDTQTSQYGTDRGRIGFYWNKTGGDGEIDIFTHRGAAASNDDSHGGFDVYDIDPGNNTEKILSVRREGIFGHQPWHKTAYHGDNGMDTNPCFVDWTGKDTNIDTFTSGPQQGLLMPFDGYIRRVVYRPDQNTNSTTFQFYKIGDTTDINALDSNTFGSSKSVTISLDNVTGIVDFDSTYSFSAGEVIGLSIDPGADAGFGMLTVTFMCNVTS
tara:strand:- start:73 stop:2280 length:2208 start_codon:yes stop_codon:yes gene_type:complete